MCKLITCKSMSERMSPAGPRPRLRHCTTLTAAPCLLSSPHRRQVLHDLLRDGVHLPHHHRCLAAEAAHVHPRAERPRGGCDGLLRGRCVCVLWPRAWPFLFTFLIRHLLFTPAVIYLATFIISVLYWSFDEIRHGRFSSGRGQPQQPTTQSKFGTTKYGAVVQT